MATPLGAMGFTPYAPVVHAPTFDVDRFYRQQDAALAAFKQLDDERKLTQALQSPFVQQMLQQTVAPVSSPLAAAAAGFGAPVASAPPTASPLAQQVVADAVPMAGFVGHPPGGYPLATQRTPGLGTLEAGPLQVAPQRGAPQAAEAMQAVRDA